MATYQAAYDPDSREVLIQEDNAAVPSGAVDIGSFDHPDPIYPGSVVAYHAVRDLLYKVSHADPNEPAMFPDNVTDMQNISILLDTGLFPVPVTEVSLRPATVTVEEQDTEQLTATVLPLNASDKGVTYESDDENIATVDSTGLVTGVLEGTATITVTTDDGGFTDTCEVTVTAS